MAQLEKYINNKDGFSSSKEVEKDSPKGKERSLRVQKRLLEFREFQKNIYEIKKGEAIKQAKKRVEEKMKDKNDDFSSDDKTQKEKIIYSERLHYYREIISGKNEKDEINVREFAYAQITDFEFNKQVFRGEDGWLENYNQINDKEKKPLEAFVLEKQYSELEKIRFTLAEVRVGEIVPKLFKDLDGDGKKAERAEKIKKVTIATEEFFSINKKSVEDLINIKESEGANGKENLLRIFRESVFPNITENQKTEMDLIEDLFNNLISDYSAMMDQRDYVEKLNPEMVSGMTQEGLTEDQWHEKLAKQAEDQARMLIEASKEKQKEGVVEKGSSIAPNFDKLYFSGGISAEEKMGEGSKIDFVSTGLPGEFLVKFPGETDEQQSLLLVREGMRDGRKRKDYIFKDPLMDSDAVVGEKGFRSRVNGLYLDHAMGFIKRGEDYLGPDLNGVLHDKEMFNLAEQLFYPKKLDKAVIETKDVLVFKNLMMVLTNNANNSGGEGIYGNLQAIRTRISLLQLVLGMDGGNKAKSFYRILADTAQDKLKNLSIEALCKLAGVEKNNGNFTKS